MKITHIHHSSFMAEPDRAILLLDHSEGNIPEIGREKPLFAFANHRHGDHFSRPISGLEENRGNMTYALSDDTWTGQVPEDLLDRTVLLGPGEEVSLEDGTGSPVDIQAFRSTDEGAAFLVSLEHRTIYYIGDLNNRVWEGEPEADSRRMSESSHQEMGKLAGRHTDAAFMPIDPRQEKDFYLGMDDFMRMVEADVVFPMYFWEDFQAAARPKALVCAGGYKDRIQEIHRREEGSLVRQTDSGKMTFRRTPGMDSEKLMK